MDYDFYVNSYLGSAIPEKAFSGVAAQAKAALERLKRNYRVISSGEESEKMALCAMAEAAFAASKRRGGVTAASAGNVSVRYEDGLSAGAYLEREMYRSAGIYLDIYRGCSNV